MARWVKTDSSKGQRDAVAPNGLGLGKSAKASILWGGGFTMLRDVAQFATMIALVRLLSPADYGSAALAQSLIGLISVVSFGTFSLHALQLRDPGEVDWQAHFTAAVVINSVLFCVTLLVAWALTFSEQYHTAAWPLAGLSTVLLIEIAGNMRHRMLETQHDWKRFRILLIIGTVLGLSTGLVVALLGGGVWALVVQVPLFGLPAAVDLFWHGKWRPQWTWSWVRYRETVRFASNRIGSSAVLRGRQTVEQTVLTGAYDFAGLGVFTRSIGLATLIAGRIGSVAMMSLYPVVTRAEQRTVRFQRIAGLVLQGVSWATIPGAVFLGICATDVVALLYGPKWLAVVPLLPLAAAGVALAGISATASSLLLANNAAKACLFIDLLSACVGVGLALWLVPLGMAVYLAALAVLSFAALLVTLSALSFTKGIAWSSLVPAFFPAVLAAAGAAIATAGVQLLLNDHSYLVARLVAEAVVFCSVYLLIIRVFFPEALHELLLVVPAGHRLMSLFYLSTTSHR